MDYRVYSRTKKNLDFCQDARDLPEELFLELVSRLLGKEGKQLSEQNYENVLSWKRKEEVKGYLNHLVEE